MFETLKIKLFGIQPVAKVSGIVLERLIQREFGNQADLARRKLLQVESETNAGKNRISAAIIKLSDKDINAIDRFTLQSKNDYRDLISQAEYPKCSKLGFTDTDKKNRKIMYLDDWTEYSKWLNQDKL
jgi:hypothetical protein